MSDIVKEGSLDRVIERQLAKWRFVSKKIEALEEDLDFLKAVAMLAEYTICNNAEGYPDYILDAARTIMQYVERKVETFEEELRDARDAYKRWHDRVLTED